MGLVGNQPCSAIASLKIDDASFLEFGCDGGASNWLYEAAWLGRITFPVVTIVVSRKRREE